MSRPVLRTKKAAFLTLGAIVAATTGCDAHQSPSSTPTPSISALTERSSNPTSAAMTCETPPSDVLAWAKEALAPHPGAVRAATMVRAATTSTGEWYVIGIDREYELDDGTPTGDGSRSLGITNAIDTPREEARMIPIGEGSMGSTPTLSWGSVSWTGNTLEVGKKAAGRAIACLEGTR